MGLESAIRAYCGALSKHNLFHARNLKLRHQREVPTQSFAQGFNKGDAFTFLVARMDGEHSTDLDEMREGCTCRTMGVLLTVNVRNHLVQVV
jgi:hypothetical protein